MRYHTAQTMNARHPIVVIDITAPGVIRMRMLGAPRVRARRYRYVRGSGFFMYVVRYLAVLRVSLAHVRGIALIEGKGSFSAARAAVSALNILQWTKGVAVSMFDCRTYGSIEDMDAAITEHRWERAHTPLVPLYQGEPHITTPKKQHAV